MRWSLGEVLLYHEQVLEAIITLAVSDQRGVEYSILLIFGLTNPVLAMVHPRRFTCNDLLAKTVNNRQVIKRSQVIYLACWNFCVVSHCKPIERPVTSQSQVNYVQRVYGA